MCLAITFTIMLRRELQLGHIPGVEADLCLPDVKNDIRK